MRRKSALSILAPAALLLQVSAASAAVCGDAYYNHEIDWPSTPNLYYSVAGAPPNTCGDLMASRNGAPYTRGVGWICTDGSGNATKGPWNSNPIDETADVYIDWGTCTSPVRRHIWDVTAPTVNITSPVPGSFYGTATDAPWGAGFRTGWTTCNVTYRDNVTGLYFSSLSNTYNSTLPVWMDCTYGGGMSVYWSAVTKPALSIHVPGRSYTWSAWLYDGGQWGSRSVTFTY